MDDELTGEEGLHHAVVVDRVPQRLHHPVVAEDRMRGVRHQIHDRAFRVVVDGDAGKPSRIRKVMVLPSRAMNGPATRHRNLCVAITDRMDCP